MKTACRLALLSLLAACGQTNIPQNSEPLAASERKNASQFTNAHAGFFSIAELSDKHGVPSASVSAYKGRYGCGAVRIHGLRNIYISALHCLSGDLIAHGYLDREIDVGDGRFKDKLFRFKELGSVDFYEDIRILAAGECFTGYSSRAIETEPNLARVNEASECLTDDWVIYEYTHQADSNFCVSVANVPAPGEKIFALGDPHMTVSRPAGLRHLDGNVYSTGTILSEAVQSDPQYKGKDIWSRNFQMSFGALLNRGEYILSSADVVGGMSGGPLLTQSGELVGLTNVGITGANHPDVTQTYSYGIHGAVSVSGILKRYPSTGQFFDCRSEHAVSMSR